MSLQYVHSLWEQQRLVWGVSMRVFQAFPKEKLDAHPIPGMRTPKELIAHMAMMMHAIPAGIVKGKIDDYESAEKEAAARKYDDFMKWVADGWTAADKAIRSLDEAKATSMVKNPWTTDFPAVFCVQIIFDEHMHHRGQLYAYLRALGIEPPFLWDFENSAKEFQPKQHQPA